MPALGHVEVEPRVIVEHLRRGLAPGGMVGNGDTVVVGVRPRDPVGHAPGDLAHDRIVPVNVVAAHQPNDAVVPVPLADPPPVSVGVLQRQPTAVRGRHVQNPGRGQGHPHPPRLGLLHDEVDVVEELRVRIRRITGPNFCPYALTLLPSRVAATMTTL